MQYVAVIGSRTFRAYGMLEERLDYFLQNVERPITIVSGGANGCDTLARLYANKRGFEVIEYLPDWDKFGKSAGFIRNKDIVERADMLVAFWRDRSKGTKSSIDLAIKKGIPYRIVEL